MKQKIINKVYFVSIIRDSKVIDILTGKNLEDIKFTARLKFKDYELQIMEYNDEYNIYVPDIEEYLMMIRRRHANSISKDNLIL